MSTLLPPAVRASVDILRLTRAITGREEDARLMELADLRALYLTIGKDELDGELMAKLSALVYPGAESEFASLLEKIEKGEPIAI